MHFARAVDVRERPITFHFSKSRPDANAGLPRPDRAEQSPSAVLLPEQTTSPSAIWYYLNESRQVGPFTLVELRLLAEKDVISPATLVWSRGRGSWTSLCDVPSEPRPSFVRRFPWVAAAVGIVGVAAASFIMASRPPDDPSSGVHKSQERLATADDPFAAPSNPSPVIIGEKGSVHVLNETIAAPAVVATAPVPPAIIRSPIPIHVREPLSEDAKRELEFWRGIAVSQNVRLYESYLRRYPSGTYVEPAAAKIKALRTTVASSTAKAKVRKKKVAPAGAVVAKESPKTEALTVAQKPRARCWNGGGQRCR